MQRWGLLFIVTVPVARGKQGSRHGALPHQLAGSVEEVDVAALFTKGDFKTVDCLVEIAQGDVLGVADTLRAIVNLGLDLPGQRLDNVDGPSRRVAARVVIDDLDLAVAIDITFGDDQ